MISSTAWCSIKHVCDDTGEVTEMDLDRVEPFSLVELLNPAGPIRVIASATNIRSDRRLESVDASRVGFHLTFRHPPTVFFLIDGGWSAPGFAKPRTFLLDRNVLDRIVRYSRGTGRIPDHASVEAVLRSSKTLNVALCAFEGRTRSEPTREEFIREYEIVSRELRAAAPGAVQIQPVEAVVDAGYQNLVDAHRTYVRESGFLRHVGPLLVEPSAPNARRAIEDHLFAAASRARLPSSSFALVTALGCLYESRDDPELMIARRVLKPRRHYSYGDAHNSISDLRALQFTAMGIGRFGDDIGLCTGDAWLAKLWCAINPKRGTWTGRRFEVSLSVSPILFASLEDDELLRLQERLAAFHEASIGHKH